MQKRRNLVFMTFFGSRRKKIFFIRQKIILSSAINDPTKRYATLRNSKNPEKRFKK